MALIVEDGVTVGGIPDAESYVDVAYADTYWSKRNNADWAALDNASKEGFLREAALYLDQGYEWIGSRKYSTQFLSWPRWVYGTRASLRWLSPDQMLPGINDIPLVLKKAQCELALEASKSALAEAFDAKTQAVASEEVGPVRVSYFNMGGKPKTFPIVDILLKDISSGRNIGGATAKAVRA